MKNVIARLTSMAIAQTVNHKSNLQCWTMLCANSRRNSDREYWGKGRAAHFVSVYNHGRAYGGPEEGGWYYSTYDLEGAFKFPCRMLADKQVRAITQLYASHGYVNMWVTVEKCKGAADTYYKPRPYYC